MKNHMIWAYLIHLSANMWGDTEDSKAYEPYRPQLITDDEVWKQTVDYLPSQGFNTLVIDLGDGVQYESHPEIAIPGAWSKDKLKAELDRIRSIGLTPLPKLNFSACHDIWMKDYSRMLSTKPYYEFCKDIITEVAELFGNPELFHLGLDEEVPELPRTYFHTHYKRDTHYIPNGVAGPVFRTAQVLQERFGLEKEDYLLFLGRLVPEKGVDDLIAAFGMVETSKRLVIAGASSDTDAYVTRLKAMAAEDARILFTGFVEGPLLQALLSNAYLYVLPSYLEGMPMSLLEAMSYGNCCLLSDIPACRETARDQAVYFPAGDRNALAQCLQTLCDDEKLVGHYRESISRHDCGKYDWNEITKRTLELYR